MAGAGSYTGDLWQAKVMAFWPLLTQEAGFHQGHAVAE